MHFQADIAPIYDGKKYRSRRRKTSITASIPNNEIAGNEMLLSLCAGSVDAIIRELRQKNIQKFGLENG